VISLSQYKWHLGLVGTEVDLFGLPPGQSAPKVDRWVQLALASHRHQDRLEFNFLEMTCTRIPDGSLMRV
jgi:hypothetical protein